ncbi:fluoride efflux transporter FluC [Mycetocola zhadangensis]|uniref:fluoride efflux transporter FluC n=1 Tax=Mycetocola zhadangensis TaxID=1164595 RepID=UPI003A4E1793
MGFRLAAVFLGGVLGTSLRWGADLLFAGANESFPVSTLLVNVLGSFVLGLLTGSLWMRRDVPPWLRAGLGAGVLGSFTTFSALASALVVQTVSAHLVPAVTYLVASLALGLGAALVGLRLGLRSGRDAGRRNGVAE